MKQTNISTYMIGKITTLFCFAMVACTLNVYAQETTKPLTNGVLFNSPCDNETYKVPHRIPAIVKTGKKLIAFADKRYSQGDVGQSEDDTYGYHIDTKMRKSYDNGETWTDPITVQGAGGNETNGFGDVAVVADREDPRQIVYFCVAGKKQFIDSEKGSTNKIYRFSSDDGGVKWTNEEITTEIYGTEGTLGNNFDGAFFSSGSILQSSKVKVGSHYRLYAAIHTNRKTGGFIGIGETNNLSTTVVYSDDFGETWNRLETSGTTPTIENGNEAKCQELPNGDIVVSCRAANGRIFNIYHYNSLPTSANTPDGYWKGQAKATFCNDSGTNGAFHFVWASTGKDSEPALYALQSIPAQTTEKYLGGLSNKAMRSHLTIYYKRLSDYSNTDTITIGSFANKEWSSYPITDKLSAYSTMTQLNDGSLAFLYEDDEKSKYTSIFSRDNWVPAGNAYDIKYQNLKISDIIPDVTAVYMNKKMTTHEKVDYSWATFYHDYPMTMPEGVTAYVATTHNETHFFIKPIEGNVIPANTAVLLVGPKEKENIMLQYGGTPGSVPEQNLLTGTVEKKIDITTKDQSLESHYKNYYVIGYGSKGVGFYRTNVGISAGLAYCNASKLDKLTAAKSSFGFIFSEGAATGIEEIKTNTRPANNTYYNLSGQAVKNPTKGIYILNGKKVIIK